MDQSIIDLLSLEAWEKAVEIWTQTRTESGLCVDVCVWGGPTSPMKCAHCLEGRLRTLSLSLHLRNHKEDLYLELARQLNAWNVRHYD